MKLDEIGISKHYMAIVSPQRPGSGAKCCWGSLEPYSHFAMSSCSCPELLSPSLASGHHWGRSMHTGCQHTLNTHRSLSSTHNFFFAELHQTFSKIALLIWYLLETKQQKNQLSLVLGARIALRGSVTLLEKCWGVTAEEGALLIHKEMSALRGQLLPSRSRAEEGAFCV